MSIGAFFGFVIEFEAFLALFDHNLFLEIDRLRVGVDHVQRLNQLVNFGRHTQDNILKMGVRFDWEEHFDFVFAVGEFRVHVCKNFGQIGWVCEFRDRLQYDDWIKRSRRVECGRVVQFVDLFE